MSSLQSMQLWQHTAYASASQTCFHLMTRGSLQYEDPTDDLQALRERVELQRALKLPWLLELAETTAASAKSAPAPAANGSVHVRLPHAIGFIGCLQANGQGTRNGSHAAGGRRSKWRPSTAGACRSCIEPQRSGQGADRPKDQQATGRAPCRSPAVHTADKKQLLMRSTSPGS